jgi:hypothetical protein
LAETENAWERSKLEWMQRYRKRTEKTLRGRKVPLVPDRLTIASVSIPCVHKRVHGKPCQSLGAS